MSDHKALRHTPPAPEAISTAILLFGEVLVDCFPDREVQGGAPLNVAHHLQVFGRDSGLTPVLVTRIGKDERGARLMERIQAAGLAIEGVQRDCLHATGEVRVAMDDAGGHRFEIVPEQAWDFIHAEMARLVALSYRPRWIYFGTLAQRGASRLALRELLRTTRARGFLDVNLRDPWVRKDVLRWSLTQVDIVKVNEEELHRIAHMLGLGGGTAKVLGERLIHNFGLSRLLVTQGEKGAWLLGHDGDYHHSTPMPPVRNAVDSVGAGDAFASVFLTGLMRDWPVELTLDRAHRFAGEVCRLRGAIPENDDFYRPFLAEWQLRGCP
jgi:fructokinase